MDAVPAVQKPPQFVVDVRDSGEGPQVVADDALVALDRAIDDAGRQRVHGGHEDREREHAFGVGELGIAGFRDIGQLLDGHG